MAAKIKVPFQLLIESDSTMFIRYEVSLDVTSTVKIIGRQNLDKTSAFGCDVITPLFDSPRRANRQQ